MRPITLVLSGGGAKGLAHLGVIKTLEEAGVVVDAVFGTSMGAFVGAFYAAGFPVEEMLARAYQVDRKMVARLLRPSPGRGGLVSNERVEQYLRNALGHRTIENLTKGYVAVAADLATGHEVDLSSGDLVTAVLASIAIPGVFKPVMHEGRVLVDGGLVNPCPFDTAYRYGADAVVASLVWETEPPVEIEDSDEDGRTRLADPFSRWLGLLEPRSRFFRLAANPLAHQHLAGSSEAAGNRRASVSALRTVIKSIRILERTIVSLRMQLCTPDVLIRLNTDGFSIFDFHRAAELIALGERAGKSALSEIKALQSGKLPRHRFRSGEAKKVA